MTVNFLLRRFCTSAATASSRSAVSVSNSVSSHASHAVPDALRYPGAPNSCYTSNFSPWRSSARPAEPVFRLYSPSSGNPLSSDTPSHADSVGRDGSLTLFRDMVRLRAMDTVLNLAQRQGRLSFYLTATGEEGTLIGATHGLRPTDLVFTQYREAAGVLLVRGAPYTDFTAQCLGVVEGHGKGRQMPIHYGDRKRCVETVSSPLATQIPHAVGAGYAMKICGRNDVAAVFFGDGAASEGDAAGAWGMAATRNAHVVFMCRNNGYAISTGTREQYVGDGVLARAVSAGMDGIRIDGNDVFAVHYGIRKVREEIVEKGRPMFVEFMSYRMGNHSTSDESERYRSEEEMKVFEELCPLRRARLVLMERDWWEEDTEKEFWETQKDHVVKALEKAEKMEKVPPQDLFEDVYEAVTPEIARQRDALLQHLARKNETATVKSSVTRT